MAHSTTSMAPFDWWAPIKSLASGAATITTRINEARQRRQSLDALAGLDDRMLDDIGLTRSDAAAASGRYPHNTDLFLHTLR